MTTMKRMTPARHSMPLLVAVGFVSISGCGTDMSAVPGRVAIEVSVQIGGTAVGDGSLVLRPEPGVKCPLILVPVVAGIGQLNESTGPVPGNYKATFRSAAAGANISEQMSATGRVAPTAGDNAATPSQSATSGHLARMPKAPISITIPDENPARIDATFEAAENP